MYEMFHKNIIMILPSTSLAIAASFCWGSFKGQWSQYQIRNIGFKTRSLHDDNDSVTTAVTKTSHATTVVLWDSQETHGSLDHNDIHTTTTVTTVKSHDVSHTTTVTRRQSHDNSSDNNSHTTTATKSDVTQRHSQTLTPLSPKMAATARSIPGESGLLNISMFPLGLKSISKPSTSTTRVSLPKQVPVIHQKITNETEKNGKRQA